MKFRVLPLLALAASPAAAQQHMHAADHMAPGVRPQYEGVRGYVIRSAEQMPEEHFAFRPTPEVRSFGAILGHIADANFMFCSQVLGEANPSQSNLEQVASKDALVRSVRESFAMCDRAFQISDAKAMEKIQIFGQERDRFYALVMIIGHTNEHYGNLVTYMRMKGLVPPSSQG